MATLPIGGPPLISPCRCYCNRVKLNVAGFLNFFLDFFFDRFLIGLDLLLDDLIGRVQRSLDPRAYIGGGDYNQAGFAYIETFTEIL